MATSGGGTSEHTTGASEHISLDDAITKLKQHREAVESRKIVAAARISVARSSASLCCFSFVMASSSEMCSEAPVVCSEVPPPLVAMVRKDVLVAKHYGSYSTPSLSRSCYAY
jgi:hypothetical protein